MSNEKLYEATCIARDQLYGSLGKVGSDVIAHAINPAFMGGPAWPALRQAFNVIRRNDSIIVASSGLSDPFDDVEQINSGFELEIMAETREDIGNDIPGSWLFKLVYAVSQQAAYSGKIKFYLDQYNVTTMELFAEDSGLEVFQNGDGMVGIMLGVEHPERPKDIEFPGGNIKLVTVKILTTEELDYVVEHRAEGRNKLHSLFKECGSFHFCEHGRESLV